MATVHVIPLVDAVAHDVPGVDVHPDEPGKWYAVVAGAGDDLACVCGPSSECVPDPDGGPDGWLITHHSVDGRERRPVNPHPR